MTRREFLSHLEELWRDTLEFNEPLAIEDVVTDSVTLGVDGASDLYKWLENRRSEP